MWDKSDFEFELERLIEDVDRLGMWFKDARSDDVSHGLERLRHAQKRLLEKLREHFSEAQDLDEIDVLFSPESMLGQLPGMMLLSGDEAYSEDESCLLCGEQITVAALISSEVIRSSEGWFHKSCHGAWRRRWPDPSHN